MDKTQKIHDFTILYLSKNLDDSASISEMLQKYDEVYSEVNKEYDKLHPVKPVKVLSRDRLL